MSYLDGLAAKGARLAGGRVVSFGDVERETVVALGRTGFDPDEAPPAAAAGASVTPLLAAGVLRVAGPDARVFLHGQLAADVRGLAVAGQVLSLLLNHKGHALADVAVLRTADGFLLLVDDGKVDLVLTSLVDHIVFDDVSVSRAPGFALSVQGAAWEVVVGALGGDVPDEGHTARTAPALPEVDGAGVHAFRRRRSVPGGADLLVVGAADADEALSAQGAERLALAVLDRLVDAGAVLVGEAALDAARVEALVPAAAFEGGDGVLPQEAGMVERLSYRKGCYLGQEIMARIEARGNLKRALALLAVDDLAADDALGAAEAAGSSVALDGRPVGRLGTLARLPGGGAAALAVLRRDVPEGATLDVLGTAARIRRWQPL